MALPSSSFSPREVCYRDEPVSRSQPAVCLGGVVEDLLDVVAVVEFAPGDGEAKASTPGLGQKNRELKLFHQTLGGGQAPHLALADGKLGPNLQSARTCLPSALLLLLVDILVVVVVVPATPVSLFHVFPGG